MVEAYQIEPSAQLFQTNIILKNCSNTWQATGSRGAPEQIAIV